MSHIGIYNYPYNQSATLGNFNMPFSSKTLTVYKGIDNNLSFTVHNADGKYVYLKDSEVLIFKMFDAKLNEIIYSSVLEPTNASWLSESGMERPSLNNKNKVYYNCVLPAFVLADISTGSKYRWSIDKISTDDIGYERTEILYTDLNYRGSADVIVSSSNNPTFVSSVLIDKDSSWKSVKPSVHNSITFGYYGSAQLFSTSPIYKYKTQNQLSTITINLHEFVGRIQLQGTLINGVPTDVDDYKWFDIELEKSKNFLEFKEPVSGTFFFNVPERVQYFRVLALVEPIIIDVEPFGVKRKYSVQTNVPKIYFRF